MTATANLQVFVSLGTDHHPFARLVEWVDRWAGDHPEVDCFIQHGTAPAPTNAAGSAVLRAEELRGHLGMADVVVGHAGPGTIMDALAHGRTPIVVARLARFGEVVDDHQVAFARVMATQGKAIVVDDEAGMRAALDAAVADPASVRVDPRAQAGADAVVRRLGELIDGMLR